MDLTQRKLTREEWNSVELPISNDEKKVIDLIKKGFHNTSILYNDTYTILSYLKLQSNDTIDGYIFHRYFQDTVQKQIEKHSLPYEITKTKAKTVIKKVDSIRIEQNTDEQLQTMKDRIYEFLLLTMISKMLKYHKNQNNRWIYYYYTIRNFRNLNVSCPNKKLLDYVNFIVSHFETDLSIENIIHRSADYIERNEFLTKFSDMKLYQHQKDIYEVFSNPNPKGNLVLYIAPTATGKTLTPIGLSEKYKVIFVCAARHVGISLSKYAISAQKKIAFGFGCSSTEDIRLHYFAAKEYTKDWRSGGIRKVDNTIGDKVEILICDIKSYIYAMYYMMAFNPKENIITYWDEPTITMDYNDHPCHEVIHQNWKENVIPNLVLSSATLPKQSELMDTIHDFRDKFPGCNIHSIDSYDCKKTIPIINKSGYAELPHYLFSEYRMIMSCVEHCESYLTLLRYFDLEEISKFVLYINENKLLNDDTLYINNHFRGIDDISMTKIKLYYLEILNNIDMDNWSDIYNHFQEERKVRIAPNQKEIDMPITKSHSDSHVEMSNMRKGGPLRKSQSVQIVPTKRIDKYIKGQTGIFITTRDAYTLTDGPTIYLADDVDKIAKFYLQQSHIPSSILQTIMESITFNNMLNNKISKLEKDIEDVVAKEEGKEKKISDGRFDDATRKKIKEAERLRGLIKTVSLNDVYVPNKLQHIEKWTHSDTLIAPPFTSDLCDSDVERIMRISDIEDIWKVLLLMGIGLFSQNRSIVYTELVKEFADAQKLYMIIANGDYIYGTNYQFCHGFIGKDLQNMTQEKAIQAMGRIGRNKLQQTYSVRYRDDNLIRKLYQKYDNKPEVVNMNRLFSSHE